MAVGRGNVYTLIQRVHFGLKDYLLWLNGEPLVGEELPHAIPSSPPAPFLQLWSVWG